MLDSARQVWGLQKHESIKHLLILLFNYFAAGELIADVDRLCHERAVCLMHSQDQAVRIYIYTYGQAAEQYGAHVEYPVIPLPAAQLNPISYENLSFERLTDLIETHLDVQLRPELPA